MIVPVLLLLVGLVALYFGADWLVRGAARLAAELQVRPIIVGLTVVSLGTSAPELVVCVLAALRGSGDLAMGNVLGSNLANIGLILGATAVFRPLRVAARVVFREVPIMLAVTALLIPMLLDLQVSRVEGLVLLMALVVYLLFVFRSAGAEVEAVLGEYEEFVEASSQVSKRRTARDLGLVALGGVGLMVGGHLIVENATRLALTLGFSELLIGLSVVALGTSLPELATSLVAAYREEADIAVGNVIGSNIFNVAAVLGIASTAAPITVGARVLSVELPAVLLLSVLVLPVVRSGYTIRRWEGALLLLVYVGLGFWVFRV